MYRQKHVALPPLEAYASEVPGYVADAIERALHKNRDERWASVNDFLDAIEPPASAGSRRTSGPRRAEAFVDEEWSAGMPWEREADEGAPPPPGDPAAVPTVSMAARHVAQRPSGAADVRELSLDEFREAHARAEAQERHRQRVRWVTAACAAVLVTGGLVAAMAGRHGMLRWSAIHGEVAADRPSAVNADSVMTVDTIAMPDAAAALASLEPLPAFVDETLPLPPLDTPAWHMTVARTRPLPHAPLAPSSPYDAVRARAATATLSLQAYQAAVAGAAPLQAPPTIIAPEPVGNDTNTPATGVRVAPRHRASSAITGSPLPDTSPAVGVRVHAPRTP